ncbi:MAG: arylsulfatase [Rhodothermaceae bacterium]|nr:arylsulfatase [Rhodothermaceae bacterium]
MPSSKVLFFCLTCLLTTVACTPQTQTTPTAPPNIILIVADDLGYGDLGAYGQTQIQTPYLDQLAAEGIMFTDFYAGSTVCAPSRAVLMTGIPVGQNEIRGNKEVRPMGQHPLQDETVTLAEVLKQQGYTTGLIGKWGLGAPGSEGEPNRQGFDYFFGYLGQRHAHNFYPEFLFRNTERIPLEGNVLPEPKREDGAGHSIEKTTYSHDLMTAEALEFVETNKESPFFLLLTLTIPHANNEAGQEGMEVPDYEPYVEASWPEPQQGLASMISRMDRDIGRLVEKVDDLGLGNNTIIFFTSDNGPHAEGGNDPTYFDSSGPLRGIKRDLYEGGIRVPLIARWSGTIEPGSVSDHMGYFGDFMATFSELSNARTPVNTNSISLHPTLIGAADQASHPYLYWEFYERGSRQAVREGDWKAVRQPMFSGELELYNLNEDISESVNVAAQHPEKVREMLSIMDEAHIPDSLWSVR